MKLRGGANTSRKVKTFDTDDVVVQNMLSMFRSLDVFKQFSAHQKCNLSKKNTRENLCSFCLLRSIVLKSRQEKGRSQIKPLEYEAAFGHIDEDTYMEDIESVINEVASIVHLVLIGFLFLTDLVPVLAEGVTPIPGN